MTDYFDIDKVFGPEYDFSELTTFPEIGLRRYQEIADGAKEDWTVFRFFDYLNDPEAEGEILNWEKFWTRSTAVAAQLQTMIEKGDRVVAMLPQSLEYVVGFWGILLSGGIAIPAFIPTEPAHAGYLEAILLDAQPKVILTSVKTAGAVRNFLKEQDIKNPPRVVVVEGIEDALSKDWVQPDVEPNDIAYLQYSSGSTRRPTASCISHRAALTATAQILRALVNTPKHRGVQWIPIFHALSLIYIFGCAVADIQLDMMEPAAMLQKPSRWINLLPSQNGEIVFSSAPDFAYGLAAAHAQPEEGSDLDLTKVMALANGSEAVSTDSVNAFKAVFTPYGLQNGVIRPAYGMSEATLGLTCPRVGEEAPMVSVDGKALAEGRFEILPADKFDEGLPQMGLGRPLEDCWVVIVKAEFDENEEFTGKAREIEDGQIGEIWATSATLANGYWGLEKETEETFGNDISEFLPDDKTHAIVDGKRFPEGAKWLRTGDCGTFHDGYVFVTGRVKDLIIVDGRNHVATDIEATTTTAAAGRLAPKGMAAFAVSAANVLDSASERTGRGIDRDTNTEQLVILAEEVADNPIEDKAALLDEIRSLIARRHGLQVADFMVLPEKTLPRTPNGKVKRLAASESYIKGEYN
ncbi:MAG TPA: AMP-binding protein [Corynebacteriales bacterium]|nr:AMP-binding protein [Mycobacteriales bacterium]